MAGEAAADVEQVHWVTAGGGGVEYGTGRGDCICKGLHTAAATAHVEGHADDADAEPPFEVLRTLPIDHPYWTGYAPPSDILSNKFL